MENNNETKKDLKPKESRKSCGQMLVEAQGTLKTTTTLLKSPGFWIFLIVGYAACRAVESGSGYLYDNYLKGSKIFSSKK